MSAEDIRSAPRLKIIARNGTGYDAIDVAACKETGVVVTNMPGGNAVVSVRLGRARPSFGASYIPSTADARPWRN